MKISPWILCIALLLSARLHAQDTLRVYFEFAKSRIAEDQFEILNSISTEYDLSALDSVHYIGVADSVGDFKDNIRLSEKRAKNVAKYCEGFLQKEIPSRIMALGERTNPDDGKNRRVDVVLYFQPTAMDATEDAGTTEGKEEAEVASKKPFCYTIDYALLHQSHLRIVTKGKKEQVMIETSVPHLKIHKKYYYSASTDDGTFQPQKVKWSLKRTGNLWWAKTRQVTTIPGEDFDRCKIFTMSDLPCDSCSEEFQVRTQVIIQEDTCVRVDQFLMENIQVRTHFFNTGWVKIRVPREYVELEDTYYIACNFDYPIEWETKKAKRSQHYYYTRLPILFNHTANIVRVMDRCKNDYAPSNCGSPGLPVKCFTIPSFAFAFGLEAGTNYHQSKLIPYAGIAVTKQGYFSRASLVAGTDSDFGFYGTFRYQFHFLSFPFGVLNPFDTWQSPSSGQYITKYGRLYFGTELRTKQDNKAPDFLEQNLHIGLAYVNAGLGSFIPRIFLQYGWGTDYMRNISSGFYPVVQAGVNVGIHN